MKIEPEPCLVATTISNTTGQLPLLRELEVSILRQRSPAPREPERVHPAVDRRCRWCTD